jgi:hypothetical protein
VIHRIRLGPPWEVETLEGRTRHVRKFGRPRHLDAEETVWLIFESLPAASSVHVNATRLERTSHALSFEITSVLQPRNEVVIVSPSADALGEVALEIRSSGL